MKCLYCGADNMPGGRFCGSCGQQLFTPTESSNSQTTLIPPPPPSFTPPPPPPLPLPVTVPVKPKKRPGLWIALGAVAGLLFLCAVLGIIIFQVPTGTLSKGSVSKPADATATAGALNATAMAGQAATATAVALSQVGATATTIASNPDPYPPKTGTLALYDHLSSNSSSQWDEGLSNDQNASCRFNAGMYHAMESRAHTEFPCYATATSFSNFTYRVEMTIIRGDCGGLLLRGNKSSQQYYVFEVCQNGIYDLYTNGAKQYIIAPTSNAAIKQGTGQVNLIAVTASSNTFTLYVNNIVVGSTTSGSYSQGQIGLVASDYKNTTEVQYTEAKVWTL